MTCSGAMTGRCQRGEAREYRGIRGPIHLCDTCYEAGVRLGMALDAVPEWVVRAHERRLPSKVYA